MFNNVLTSLQNRETGLSILKNKMATRLCKMVVGRVSRMSKPQYQVQFGIFSFIIDRVDQQQAGGKIS